MSDPRKMAILAPNFLVSTYSAAKNFYTAATVPADMPLALLLTDEPADRSRLLTHDPIDTFWNLYLGNGSSSPQKTIGGMGLINVNISRFGKYRFLADPVLGGLNVRSNFYERLAPSALLASTNLTGAVTDIDESPRSPDGLWNTPTTLGTEWVGRWSFPTPATAPAIGASKQAFVLWVKRVNGDVTAQYPVLNCQLWENGALKSDLGTKVVTNGTGQILIFRWDTSLLATASGADVEIKLFASGTAPSAGTSSVGIHLGALAWDSEKSTPVMTYDSGWLTSPFGALSSRWGGTAADEVGPEPTRNLTYFPETTWTFNAWVAMFSDDQADDTYAYSATKMVHPSLVLVPDGYAQAGVAVAAPTFIPSEVNFGRGPLVSARDPSPRAETHGGQEVGSRRRGRRVLPVILPQLTEAEGYDLFDRIDWRRGTKLPVLVVKYPDGDATVRRHTTLWATLEDLPGLAIPSAFNRHSWSGVFVEKL